MKHATAAALDRLEPLLAELRELPGLREKFRGVLYRMSAAYLHFHEDKAGLFADIRRADGEFDRHRVETEDERTAFIGIARSGLKRGATPLLISGRFLPSERQMRFRSTSSARSSAND